MTSENFDRIRLLLIMAASVVIAIAMGVAPTLWKSL